MISKALCIVGGWIAGGAVICPTQAQTLALPPLSVSVQNCARGCASDFLFWDTRTGALRPPIRTCMPSPNAICGKVVVPFESLNPRTLEALKAKYYVVPIVVESQNIPSGYYALILAKSTGPVPWANKAFVFEDIQFAAGNVTFKIAAP